MQKLILSLALIALGLILGKVIRWFEVTKRHRTDEEMPGYLLLIRGLALLVLNPFIVATSFWVAALNDVKLIAIPLLGVSALALGGGAAIIFSKILGHDREKTGSMFVSGSFTNLGTFGGLICFAFFGEQTFVFVSMYKLLEEVYYYLIGYPIAKSFAAVTGEKKNRLKMIITDPYVIVYFSSILFGFILNRTGITRPRVFTDINTMLIPIISVLLVSTVGYSMKFSKIGGYLKECLIVSGIKFIITPVVIILAAWLIGLPTLEDGLVFKVVIILSFMPTAFNALIPPQIYGLDKDLANSSWLFTTAMLLVVVPILSFIV